MRRIEYLQRHSAAIPVMAAWFHREWGHFYPERSLQDVEQLIAERTHTDRIPLTLVAYDDEELVGSVCLKQYDMDDRRDLTPWLAGLYVKASRRGEGIGRQLVAAIEQRARELGIETLYLFTPASEGFYRQLGWTWQEDVTYHGYAATIMFKPLAV